MKKAFVLLSIVLTISCAKKDSPNPNSNSSTNNNTNGTTSLNTIPYGKCGDLSLMVNYKGQIHTDNFAQLFFFNHDMQFKEYYLCCTEVDTMSWLYNNISNTSEVTQTSIGGNVLPPINKTYLQSWTYPKKFEIGDTYGNPSTADKLTFYFTYVQTDRAYFTGETIQKNDPSAPNGVVNLGVCDTTNSYLVITSMKPDTRITKNGQTVTDASKTVNGQEVYIATAHFKVIQLLSNDTITGSFTSQILVDPNH